MAWVYVLRGESGRLYVDATENLAQRLEQHHHGSVHTTKRMGQLTLVGTKEFPDIQAARAYERFLKARKDPRRVLWYLSQSSPA